MIKITYGQLKNFGGARALGNKLMNTPMAPKMSYSIKKILEQLTKKSEAANGDFIKFQLELADKFGKKDLEGKIIRPEGQPDGFEVPTEQMEAYEKELASFDERSFLIDWTALSEEAFKNMQMPLSAAEWSALEPFFVEHGAPQAEAESDNDRELHQKAVTDHVAGTQPAV